MSGHALTDDHGYVQATRETRHLCHGANLEWVDEFLAAGPRQRRAMLGRWFTEHGTDGVSNRDRHKARKL